MDHDIQGTFEELVVFDIENEIICDDSNKTKADTTMDQKKVPGLFIRPILFCPGDVTVLFVDIKNFTATCAEMSTHEIGMWMSDFYEQVFHVGKPMGVLKAEVRGDCCICVTGAMQAAPCARLWSDASANDQMTRMLKFSMQLYETLKAKKTFVRMGVAFGEAAFLVHNDGFICAQGDVVNTAARMEEIGTSGMVMVHESAVRKWMDEQKTGCNSMPYCCLKPCKGKKDPQSVAMFDCVRDKFV